MGRPVRRSPGLCRQQGDPTTVGDQVEKTYARSVRSAAGGAGGGPRAADRTQINHLKRSPGLRWISALRHHQGRRLVESRRFSSPCSMSAIWPKSAARTIPANGSSSATTRWAEHRRQKRLSALLTATEEALAGIPSQVAIGPAALISDGDRRETRPRQEHASQVAKHFRTRGSQTGPSTMSGARKPSSGRRNWTGLHAVVGPANRPIACQQPQWCAATRT